MSTYLVTGATGFLGSYLVEILLDAGHDIVALCRRPQPTLAERGVKVVEGDINDAEAVEAAAKGCDGVYHLAGVVSRDPEDNGLMLKANYTGALVVADAAKKAGVPRMVHASTSGTIAITEDGEIIPNEDDPTPYGLAGKWPYYRSKLYAEIELLKRSDEDFEIVFVNPSLLLGPGDLRGSSTEDVQLFLERKIAATPAGGLSFVDVRDVAETLPVAMEKGRAGKRYLLGATNLTFAEFFGRLSRLSDVAAPRVPVPKNNFIANISNKMFQQFQDAIGAEEGPDEHSLDMAQHFWYVDASRAEEELDFHPRDPMDTLNDTIQDLYDRGVVWPHDWKDNEPSAWEEKFNKAQNSVQDAISTGVKRWLKRASDR